MLTRENHPDAESRARRQSHVFSLLEEGQMPDVFALAEQHHVTVKMVQQDIREWRKSKGTHVPRQSAKKAVRFAWYAEHPDFTTADAIERLGVSEKTVYQDRRELAAQNGRPLTVDLHKQKSPFKREEKRKVDDNFTIGPYRCF